MPDVPEKEACSRAGENEKQVVRDLERYRTADLPRTIAGTAHNCD